MPYFAQYTKAVSDALLNMKVTIDTGEEKSADEGLAAWCDITCDIKANNATMFFAGNGASAMMAGHMAADASKNGGFRGLAFNDAALMTAIGNDISYDEVFALPLGRFADPGDVLVTISSSGNSPNIIRAIKKAREIGLTVVTVSGMGADNRSRAMGDLNFYVPAATYGIAEASHQVLLHGWLDRFMEMDGR
ncbi:MAG: SIS domain-containing protein [Desulfobacterales bacterium]|nr:SIS domain-containing protein [Desulfobacterales bacterium]